MCLCEVEIDSILSVGSKPPPIDPVARASREMLGLPTDRPVLLTGHQPVVPHPGILAKSIALKAYTEHFGWAGAHLTIDTGTEAVGRVDVLTGTTLQNAKACSVQFLNEETGVLAYRPPASIRHDALPDGLPPEMRVGCAAIVEAFQSAKGPTAAAQASEAVAHLRARFAETEFSFMASQILSTPAGQKMLDAMREDPAGCVAMYNKAIESFPNAGIRTLLDGADPELPLWVMDGSTCRVAHHSDLDADALLPKALTTTAIARSALADGFIHGTGGGKYDRVAESWIGQWLGWTLAPFSVVTANAFLPGFSPDDYQAFTTDLRKSIHDPASEDGVQLSKVKAAMLDAINAAPRGSKARAEAFAAFQDWRASIATTPNSASNMKMEDVCRRDWAFPLYPNEILDRLKVEVYQTVNAAINLQPSSVQ